VPRRFRTDDDGSILLSFLAMLVISGLLLTVAGTMLNGQKQTRFDRDFEQALQVAEIGQSQLVSLIQSRPDVQTVDPVSGTTAEGGSYEAFAVKSAYSWVVTSKGKGTDGRERTVEVQVRVRPLFSLAAFGKESMTLNGGNGADSFDSSQGTDICRTIGTDYIFPGLPAAASSNSADVDARMCKPTKLGTVATNGELRLAGQVAADADRFEIHNAARLADGTAPPGVLDPLPGATGVCAAVAETCAAFYGATPKGKYYRDPIEVPPINQCNDPDTVPAAYNGDTPTSDQRQLRGERYFFTDAVLTGRSLFTGTLANPTRLCISGKLTIKEANLINFRCTTVAEPMTLTTFQPSSPCPGGGRWVPRRPGTLLIFLTGQGGSSVELGNHASVSAAIFAPTAHVQAAPQGNLYGSVVANSVSTTGGWNFHYDDALGALTANAPVRVQNWRELG
jgi:hypothetical protein